MIPALSEDCMRPLFYYWYHKLPEWSQWPEETRLELEREAKRQFLIEMARREETQKILAKFADKSVEVLVLKGAAMGALYYPQAGLRPCEDTDLLIQEKDRENVDAVMQALNFKRDNQISGRLVNFQFTWYRYDELQMLHTYDFHLKISNAHVFSNTFGFEELKRDAIPVAALGPFACTLPPAQALLYACMHRVAHHYDDEHAIWLYDIHLLAQKVHWPDFIQLAKEKKMRAVCLRGLQLTQKRFQTQLPENWENLLAGHLEAEPSSIFLKTVRSRSGVIFSDLKALSSWQDQVQLILEHLFPPVSYMKEKYSIKNPIWLPLLYVYRIARGCVSSILSTANLHLAKNR